MRHPQPLIPLHLLLIACLLLWITCLVVSGCSGGGGSTTSMGNARFTFPWPAAALPASRAGIVDANSLVVEIGGQRGVLQRSQTALTMTDLPPGLQRYTARAYASTNGAGVPLAEAEGILLIVAGQTVEKALHWDSDSATELALGQLVAAPNISVEAGKTIQLTVTAINAQGEAVLVALNGFAWHSADTNIATVANGLITGVSPGTSLITATYGTLTVQSTVTVTDQNTAPTANFTVSPASGDVTTNFQFDASSCTDAQDTAAALQVRWDWQEDGTTYNTSYSTTKTAQHQYATPGTYTVRLEVKDSGGKTATTEKTVMVKVKLSVSLAAATLTFGQQQTFTTQVQGSAQTGVTWSVEESNGGSMTGNVYTAPQTPGTYHLIATSVADPTVHVTIPITVQDTSSTVTVQ